MLMDSDKTNSKLLVFSTFSKETIQDDYRFKSIFGTIGILNLDNLNV